MYFGNLKSFFLRFIEHKLFGLLHQIDTFYKLSMHYFQSYIGRTLFFKCFHVEKFYNNKLMKSQIVS